MQIRLDVPIKDENDSPDKSGTKYIWLSSVGKEMGTSSGSPVHFVGDPFPADRVCLLCLLIHEPALPVTANHIFIHYKLVLFLCL